MNKIEITNKILELIYETVEYDLVRYALNDDTEMYGELLSLHVAKIKYLIGKGKFKTQDELIEFTIKYRDGFEELSIPNNLVY